MELNKKVTDRLCEQCPIWQAHRATYSRGLQTRRIRPVLPAVDWRHHSPSKTRVSACTDMNLTCTKRSGEGSDKRVEKIIAVKEGIQTENDERQGCTAQERRTCRDLMGTGRAKGGAGALNFESERPGDGTEGRAGDAQRGNATLPFRAPPAVQVKRHISARSELFLFYHHQTLSRSLSFLAAAAS